MALNTGVFATSPRVIILGADSNVTLPHSVFAMGTGGVYVQFGTIPQAVEFVPLPLVKQGSTSVESIASEQSDRISAFKRLGPRKSVFDRSFGI